GGARGAWVAGWKLYARLSSVGSLQAVRKNEIPTGNPRTKPAGTVMCGYPATAAGVVHPGQAASPSTRSFRGAGPDVGATIASTLCFVITASMPSARESFTPLAPASQYTVAVSGPLLRDAPKNSWSK